jgi:hypothetical protein
MSAKGRNEPMKSRGVPTARFEIPPTIRPVTRAGLGEGAPGSGGHVEQLLEWTFVVERPTPAALVVLPGSAVVGTRHGSEVCIADPLLGYLGFAPSTTAAAIISRLRSFPGATLAGRVVQAGEAASGRGPRVTVVLG